MTEEIEIPPRPENLDGLDNPIRAVIVTNEPGLAEGSMEERMLDVVQTFDEVDAFFDKFDEEVAVPNEGHLKYEVGSDGLVVFVVDSKDLSKKVSLFIDEYSDAVDQAEVDEVVEPVKRRRENGVTK